MISGDGADERRRKRKSTRREDGRDQRGQPTQRWLEPFSSSRAQRRARDADDESLPNYFALLLGKELRLTRPPRRGRGRKRHLE